MNETPVPEGTPKVEEKKDYTKPIIIVVVILVVLYGVQMVFSPERMSENMMERAIERASDGNADVDIDVDRNGVTSATFSGEDGETYTMNAGGNVALPDNWPKSVPLVGDAKITYAGSMMGGQAGGLNVVYTTKQSASEVDTFYKRELVSNGYTLSSTMATQDGTMVTATKGENENVMVYTGSSPEGTTVTITTQSAQ
jgi:hypothetical protein